jgi:hypothetical protein
MHRYHGLFRHSGAFFQHQFSADYTISTFGFDFRQGQHPVLIEQFDQLGEVGERAGDAIDLVDHHGVDLAGPDIGQEFLQGPATLASFSSRCLVATLTLTVNFADSVLLISIGFIVPYRWIHGRIRGA